jgi:hypothetical protein
MTDPRSSAAPGSTAGYIFQLLRALAHLAEAEPGDRVGIETEDDVVRESKDGFKVLEQDKHSLDATRTGFTDRSLDLWKTLAIWARSIRNGDHLRSGLEFHLVTNRLVGPGLARGIAEARTTRAINEVIRSMRDISSDCSATIKPFVDEVLTLSRDNLAALIIRVRLYDADDSSAGDALTTTLARKLRLPEGVDPELIIQGLLGWLQQLCMQAWCGGLPAWATAISFNNQLWRLVEKQRTKLVIRAVGQIPVASSECDALRDHTFVRQISLLEMEDETDVVQAMNDFIRANVERARIVDRGDITIEDWADYENRLIDRWARLKNRLRRNLKKEAPDYPVKCIDVGREIFDGTLTKCTVPLAGVTVDEYLSNGHYHYLADDGETVGWHPDFNELLRTSAAQ